MEKQIFNELNQTAIQLNFIDVKLKDPYTSLNDKIKDLQEKYGSETIKTIPVDHSLIKIMSYLAAGGAYLLKEKTHNSYSGKSDIISFTITEPKMNFDNALEMAYLLGKTLEKDKNFKMGDEYKGQIVMFQDFFANRFAYNDKEKGDIIISNLPGKRGKHIECLIPNQEGLFAEGVINEIASLHNIDLRTGTSKYFDNKEVYLDGNKLLCQKGVEEKSSYAFIEKLKDAFVIGQINDKIQK
ncbi:hypothetical protein N9934_03585 [Desulfosarcina sp.]|nr:hypothetical protein [Desulfosarcina sp.]